jgi:RNA polymerase sigma-70 factor (ECF subfamily)
MLAVADSRTQIEGGRYSLAGPEMTELVETHSPALFRFALSIVGDQALAEDVVQEALIKAWRKGPVGDDGKVPRAWLMKVTRNTAISLLRARRDLMPGDDALPEAENSHSTSGLAEGREAVGQLGVALRSLDEDARGLILLREIDGLSYDEIADLLEIPLHTVKTRLFRARRALKAAMEEWR